MNLSHEHVLRLMAAVVVSSLSTTFLNVLPKLLLCFLPSSATTAAFSYLVLTRISTLFGDESLPTQIKDPGVLVLLISVVAGAVATVRLHTIVSRLSVIEYIAAFDSRIQRWSERLISR